MILPLLLAAPLFAQTQGAVTIDPHKTWGKWEGWGTSLAWWGKVFGNRKDIADLVFTMKTVRINGQPLPGLGMNIVRYNAGACSWNEIDGRRMVVSKNILPFRQIEGFWLDGKNADPRSKSWDWSVDANQRDMLRMARKRGANRFELFSNSPMWWMCANDNPSGAKEKGKDNLPPENYRAFAIYLATIAKYAKDHWGIRFTSVEPFNEPVPGWWTADGKQEGCNFSTSSQAVFLPYLREELDRRGLSQVPIAASDASTYSKALENWNAFSSPVKALVDQFNVHGYEGIKGPREQLYHAAVLESGKRLWNSEYGDKLADGVRMARCIQLDLHRLHPSAWVFWQILDDGNKGGWGVLGGEMIKGIVGPVNPKYFVLAQFTRHIRPGMIILDSGHDNTVAAYQPARRRLVLVTFNDGPARDQTYDLSKFASARGPVLRWMTEPRGTARYQKLSKLHIEQKTFTVHLPANSLHTFEIDRVAL